jgi:neutral ceramidase
VKDPVILTNTRKMSADISLWGVQKPLTCPGRQRTNTGREGQPGTYEDGDPVVFHLGVLGIGDIALTTVNAEIYTLISQRMKKHSPMANTIMVTLANGRANSGYLPNDAAFGAYTFQVLGSRLKPGCAEHGIANTLDGLVAQYAGR